MGWLSTKPAKWVNGLRCALFPPACLFCGAPLEADGCCERCLAAIHPWPRDTCHRCGRPLGAAAPGPCGGCLRHPPPMCACVHLYRYEGPVRQAILDWKLRGRGTGVAWLLHVGAERLSAQIGPDDLLLPVPMPLSRMRRRGLHHAANLCRMIAAETGCRFEWRALRRKGEQPRQSSLTGRARRQNLRGAFVLAPDWRAYLPATGRLWIVDDILTTGATMREAARTLARTGHPIHALSLSRAGE
ncbi:MAG: ComF family protein [Mariprofundaceae bacterium]